MEKIRAGEYKEKAREILQKRQEMSDEKLSWTERLHASSIKFYRLHFAVGCIFFLFSVVCFLIFLTKCETGVEIAKQQEMLLAMKICLVFFSVVLLGCFYLWQKQKIEPSGVIAHFALVSSLLGGFICGALLAVWGESVLWAVYSYVYIFSHLLVCALTE